MTHRFVPAKSRLARQLQRAEARTKSARDQIAVLQDQLQQNNLQTEQSKVDANGRVRQAEADVAAAQADLASQEASFQIADFDRNAYNKLVKTGAASERQAKQANATAEQQEAAVAAARRRLEAARGSLNTAQATLSNPGIREFQASGGAQADGAAGSRDRLRCGLGSAGALPTCRSPGQPPRPDCHGAFRRHGYDARG
jgi:chromosome segregation ATPase